MRKIIIALFVITVASLFVTPASAKTVDEVFGTLTPPAAIRPLTQDGGSAGISLFLTWVIEVIYIFAAIVFLFMVIFSAFQWITSGGDKEAVAKARSRLTYAILGIVLLGLAFFIATLIGQLTGFKFFQGQTGTNEVILPPDTVSTPLTVEEYERKRECNARGSFGFIWDERTRQCVSTNEGQ